MTWHRVASIGEVTSGDVVGIEVNGLEMVLGREGDAFYAYQRYCPHRGGDLSYGLISRSRLICPMHGWAFIATTGMLERSSDVCLVRYATRVVGDQVEVDPTPLEAAGGQMA